MQIVVPYGHGEALTVRLDERRVAGVIYPNRVSVADREHILEDALRRPLGGVTFDQFLEDADELLVLVNDATRPTPTAEVLVAIASRLEGLQVQFLVATGSHRRPTEEENRRIFGPLYERYEHQIAVHDARRPEAMVSIGTSRRGTEFHINRRVLEASRILVIGSVEPHYFAGYTGGRKAFLPGVAGFETIEQNHRLAMLKEARSLALEGNPVHEDMVEILEPLADKQIFAIHTVLDREHSIYACAAGDIQKSFEAATEKAAQVFVVKVPEKVAVVVTAASYPLDVDLYQSQKALENGKLVLNDEGILILVSKCRAGLGQEAFARLLREAPTPGDALNQIAGGYRLGYHKAAKIAEIASWAQLWALTGLRDDLVEELFIRPVHNLQSALDEALLEKGPQARVLFLMAGSLTVPTIQSDERNRG